MAGKQAKILIVINSLLLGGAEQQVLELARRLRQRGWEVAFATLRPGGDLRETLIREQFPLHQIDWCSRKPLQFLQLIQIIRAFRPQVVHAHLAYANIATRLCRAFCSMPVLICTAHSLYEHSRRLDLRGKLLDLLYRWTDPLCDRTTIVCEAGAQRYRADGLVPAERIQVVYNGVDTARFQPLPCPPKSAGKFRWVSVGRLSTVKDYPTMLEAFARCLKAWGPEQQLDIIGGGKQHTELIALSRSLGLQEHVHFHGSRPDVVEFLNRSDAFLQSSEWEGFPVVLLESASLGLPVVATDVGGNREIVVHGKTGLLAPPGDPAALAGCMLNLLQMPERERLEWGQAARRQVLERFSMDSITDQWEEMYRQMLDDKQTGRQRRDSVREYFNRIAADYRGRYATANPYYQYFFHERMSEALNGERGFSGKVLDIGAGTGPLYDALQPVSPQARYTGLDISEEMLANSKIPPENQIVGEFPQATTNLAPFERIYCLGVTTYLDRPALRRLLQGLADQLEPGGVAVVTFTNLAAFDSLSRAFLHKLSGLPIFRHFMKDRVVGQSFSVHESSLRQVISYLPGNLELTEAVFLNHTLTPLNRFLPRPCVALARYLHPRIKNVRWLGFLSTDFLVRLRKQG